MKKSKSKKQKNSHIDITFVLTKKHSDSVAAQYNIPEDYPLHENLSEAFEQYFDDLIPYIQTPRSSEHKSYLLELQERAAALYDSLSKMNEYEEVEWWIDSSNAFPDRWIIDDCKRSMKWNRRMKADCRALESITSSLAVNKPTDKGGQPSEKLYGFINALATIYKEASKNQVKTLVYYDPMLERYVGDFQDFVRDCLHFLNIKKTDFALGKAIIRAFKNS